MRFKTRILFQRNVGTNVSALALAKEKLCGHIPAATDGNRILRRCGGSQGEGLLEEGQFLATAALSEGAQPAVVRD